MRRDQFTPQSPGTLTDITVTESDRFTGRLTDVTSPAFLPGPLPEQFDIAESLQTLLEEATHLLGTLNGIGSLLPNPHLLVRPFVRREAVASSKIEGTVTTFRQLLTFEQGGTDDIRASDAQEVLNYVRALEHGLNQPPDRGITSALIRELHEILLRGVRGDEFTPGRFRRGTVYIGSVTGIASARFVPPPADEIPGLMLDLERSITYQTAMPRLVRIGTLHYQFEAIHPFSDGNGRTGRLLIALMLRDAGLLQQPLLHLSRFFERSKDRYLDGLLKVSLRGDWLGWTELFLEGIATEARRAAETVGTLLALRDEYRRTYRRRNAQRLTEVTDLLFSGPVLSITGIADTLQMEYKTAGRMVALLVADGVLVETTGKRRNRIFLAPEIMRLLEE
jgi:Fic family protein